ncbi:MAG: TetR family transcriptional regulator [Rhodospirillales bacterium]|nr:MAG: TetR family transcriptional regulator [Rhodospirillales bacterium]
MARAATAGRRRAAVEPAAPTKAEATRQRILDAAARVFARRGYADTRLSDIADEAGTFAGSIYYYFDSRETLVAEVLDIGVRRVFDAVRADIEALPAGAGHRERIAAAIHAHLAFTLSIDDFATANQRLFAQVPAEIRQRHIHVHRAYGDYWRKLLEAARRGGAIRRDLDLSVLRLQLLGAINWSLEWYKPGRRSVRQIANQLADMVFDGVAPK